ncbi:MAG TPA: DUF4214 domain-containing protein [Pirellulales bacterium]|nr:DUF4214 domain-containing protein [Pirellulales bacterium]
MFLRNWRSRLVPVPSRAIRRRHRKLRSGLQSLEPRTLLSVTPTGATIAPIETQAFTGTVATFTADDAGPFSATIDWGDGTITPGTVAPNGSGFDVTGTHTYSEDGSTLVSVVITDAADSTTATAASTANVKEGTFALSGVAPLTATEGVALSGLQVATINDPGSPDTASDFTAAIDWGDGTTTTGTITGSGGNFTVTGNHTYADEFSGNLNVTVTEPSASFTIGPNPDKITVAEADTLTAPPNVSGTGSENNPNFQVIVPFTNTNAAAVASDFTGTIDWGDGATTTGTVNGSGTSLAVQGTHLYADEGVFLIHVTLADDGPGTATATFTGTGTVTETDTPTPSTAQPTVNAFEQQSFTGNVAVFTNSGYQNNPGSDFTATIDWGDGTVDVGVPVTGGSGSDLTVSGTHTYAEDGSYVITTTLADDAPGTVSATATNTASVKEGAFALSGTAPLTATEGVALSGLQVATFNDAGSPDTASDFTAAIDWGDGTTTTGTITGSGGNFTVTGNHTYADEFSGNLNVTVTEPSANFTIGPNPDSITVAEADTLTPVFVTTGTVSENESLGGTAAVFHDAGYASNPASDFTGTFDWGDGTTFTTGAGNVTITSDGAGNVTLSVAGHSYADEGAYTVVATLADDSPGTTSLSQTGTLTVIEADAFTPSATPATITGTEGATASGTVAVFNDTGYPTNVAGDFTATVDWGDGSSNNGTVSTTGDGKFTVSSSHAYTDDGTYTITTKIVDDLPGSVTASTTAMANIAESGLTVSPAATTFAVTEGVANSGIVATISDPGSTDPAADYTATINWGDGTTTTGSVSGAAGLYSIAGDHTYADEGAFTISVVATETAATPTATATTSAIVEVSDSDALTGAASAAATEGTTFTGTVATFTDAGYPGNVAGDFTAVIDWGDGTTTSGTVTGSTGAFTVSGVHMYASEGSFPLSVTLIDNSPGTATATATGTATVADNDTLMAGAAATLAGTEGATVSGVLATFTDTTYPTNIPADFLASIDWGDGSTTSGTVSGTPGSFTVTGSHVYAEEGTKTATIVLADDTPNTSTGTATAIINVADAALAATGATIAPTEGLSFSGVVANFTDADPNGTASDYTAMIAWGDGSTTSGTVAANGSGGFQVTGDHTYTEEGTSTITVTIADVGGSTADTISTAHVADATLSATAVAVSSPEYTAFSGKVATFTDADPKGTASDYTATIDWGDGSTTSGTVAANGSGAFNVTGSHTYAEDGTRSVVVTIVDAGGSTAQATAAATVSEPSFSISPVTITAHERSAISDVTVATFQHGNGAEPASGFTATIGWGDGATSTGTVSESGTTYTVVGSHTYLDEQTFPISVQIKDDTASAFAASSAHISEELLPDGTVGTPNERFIAEIYRDLLHRPADQSAIPFWSAMLDHGQTRLQVAQAIIEAAMPTELSADLAQGMFQKYLGRTADADGLAYWQGKLNGDETLEQTEAAFVATPEFFTLAGSTNDGFVNRLFETTLGRSPDPNGRAYYEGLLASGSSREQVADLVFASHEYHQKFVTDTYQSGADTNDRFTDTTPYLDDLDFLDRPSDPSGLAAFTNAMDNGLTEQQVWADFMSSDEFFAKTA